MKARMFDILNATREFPNSIILYTASLYLGWGIMFLSLDELPLPFAGIQWYAEHGGQVVWGPVFTAVALMAFASVIAKSRKRKLFLIAPALITVWLGAYGMIALLILGYSSRLLIGSGYVVPHAIWIGASVFLDYALPQQYPKGLAHHIGENDERDN